MQGRAWFQRWMLKPFEIDAARIPAERLGTDASGRPLPKQRGRHDYVRQARGRLREAVRPRRGTAIQGERPSQQVPGLVGGAKLGLSGDEADAYAKGVVMADFEEIGDDDVFRKIRKDFDAKGVSVSDHQIRRTMDELMAKAIQEIKAGS